MKKRQSDGVSPPALTAQTYHPYHRPFCSSQLGTATDGEVVPFSHMVVPYSSVKTK